MGSILKSLVRSLIVFRKYRGRLVVSQILVMISALYLAALEAATNCEIQGFALTIVYPGGELLFYDENGPRPRR